MAYENRPSKKELKELRKIEKMKYQSMDKRQGTIKWIAIAVVSLLFLVFFIGLVINGKNRNKPQTADGKTSISENTGRYRMGNLTEGELSTDSGRLSNAKVTLVEYADFQCPACKSYHPVVKELLAAYPNDVKLLFKHFPLVSIHPNAQKAAHAVEAAGEQGKFFEFADLLYDKQGEWSGLGNPDNKFQDYAGSLNLDKAKFKEDYSKSEIADRVEEQRNEGITNGVNGTPAFFLNGEKIENPGDLEGFKKLVDEALAKTGGDGPTKAAEPTTAPSESLPLQ